MVLNEKFRSGQEGSESDHFISLLEAFAEPMSDLGNVYPVLFAVFLAVLLVVLLLRNNLDLISRVLFGRVRIHFRNVNAVLFVRVNRLVA